MHRDLARHLVFLSLTYLLVSAAGPAPLLTGSLSSPPPLPDFCHRDDDRRNCRHATRSLCLAVPAPQPRPLSRPGRTGPDPQRPTGGGVTRRGRRGASASTVRWKGSEGSKLAKHTTRKLTPWCFQKCNFLKIYLRPFWEILVL